jgi:hypothetical protein
MFKFAYQHYSLTLLSLIQTLICSLFHRATRPSRKHSLGNLPISRHFLIVRGVTEIIAATSLIVKSSCSGI